MKVVPTMDTTATPEPFGGTTAMIECCFCNRTVPSPVEAIDAEWIPSFWKDAEEIDEPVCPDCTTRCLSVDSDGEWVIGFHALRFALLLKHSDKSIGLKKP